MPKAVNAIQTSTDRPAELVIRGGPVLTMNPDQPRAESVAVRDGRITAVGTTRDIDALVGSATEVIDLQGHALLPGFIDPHMHSAMVQLADWVDVSPMATPSADAVFAALRNATSTTTGWVLAQQFDPSITRRPSAT